jgi:hypothetical protein
VLRRVLAIVKEGFNFPKFNRGRHDVKANVEKEAGVCINGANIMA